ncbi:MAG: helix-turn-helix domain-containing protein [Gammaproteobacteria bacterium]
MNKLSEVLKALLKHRKLTVSELSRHTGIVQPVIYRMTTGETDNPKLSSLLPIANYFNVNISQLIGEEPLDATNAPEQKTKAIPLLNWNHAHEYAKYISTESKSIMVAGLSDQAFALVMPDTSMEPMFQRGSLLIFDPLIEPQDRSFVLVHLGTTQTNIIRQLIIDADQKYLKPLNPDFNLFKMRLLDKNDTLLAHLVESRNYHNNQLTEGES